MAAFAPPEVDLGLHGFLLKVGWGRVAHVGELGDRGLGTGWALLCHRRAMLSTARSRWHGPGADLDWGTRSRCPRAWPIAIGHVAGGEALMSP